jgi:sigma-B regulation protein RsbU (phosphoserine phosphatase)
MTHPPPALETAATDEALRAVRVLVDAYQLSADSRDVDRVLNGILDCVARLVDYDSGAVYVLGSSGRHVRHYWWRDDSGAVPCHDGALEEGRPVARAIETREPVLLDEGIVPADGGPCHRSGLVVPLVGVQKVMGAIELHSRRPAAYDARAIEMLQLLGAVIAGTIERSRLQEEVRAKRRIDAEMLVARQVMEDLIPRDVPSLDGLDIAGVNEASFEVGGDYYEFIPLPEDRWGIIIADVAGKGIGAALQVSAIRASIYALVDRELAIRAVMRRANRFFFDSVDGGRYVTLFYAVLDVSTRQMIYVNAGHQPPLLVRPDGAVEKLWSGGVPIGMFESPRYFEGGARLRSGDLLALYTDGIVESSNAHDEEFGHDRLVATMHGARTESAQVICQRVMDDVRGYSFGSPDDRTLLVLKAT